MASLMARSAPVRLQGLLCIALVTAAPGVLPGQEPAPGHTEIQWWHGAALAGGVSALMLLDGSVRHFAQGNRSGTGDGIAGAVRHFGQPEVYGTVTAGLLAAGLLGHNPRLTTMGTRLAGSLALAAGLTGGVKFIAGRARPDDLTFDGDADDFMLFSNHGSWPSGHSAMAFAFATALGDELHEPWARWGLYGAATAVAWSRINDNRHWLSDVAGGAVVGIASAKFASGRWRIFGLRAPGFIVGPGGAGVGWEARF